MGDEILKSKPFMAALGVIALAIMLRAVIALAVPYGPNAEDKSDSVGSSIKTLEKGEESKEPKLAEPAARDRTFKGSGVKITSEFPVETGLVVFKVTRSGEGAFSIQLKTAGGEDRELIINQNGPIAASKALGLPSGSYKMSVAGSGGWEVSVEQPRPASAPSPPVQLTGNSSQASQFFSLKKGNARFNLKHSGEASFGPTLLRGDGTVIDVLANETGNFQGVKNVNLETDGFYVIDVIADADWTISISQ